MGDKRNISAQVICIVLLFFSFCALITVQIFFDFKQCPYNYSMNDQSCQPSSHVKVQNAKNRILLSLDCTRVIFTRLVLNSRVSCSVTLFHVFSFCEASVVMEFSAFCILYACRAASHIVKNVQTEMFAVHDKVL